jgi:hypothetical protein
MANFSIQIINLLFVACLVQFFLCEAARITSRKGSENDLMKNVDQDENNSKDNQSLTNVESSKSTALEASETGRQKYSYYYIGRWTWQGHLWVTLLFSFYVFGNVIRSIYGHTVKISVKSLIR